MCQIIDSERIVPLKNIQFNKYINFFHLVNVFSFVDVNISQYKEEKRYVG